MGKQLSDGSGMLEQFLNDHPWIGGAVMAIFMSILRVVYDGEETKPTRILLEGLICGSLTIMVGSALQAMDYSQEWVLFAGGLIGFMGSQFIRLGAKKLIGRHLGKED